jgi:hypothetical protein
MSRVNYSLILTQACARCGLPSPRPVDGVVELQDTDANLLREGAWHGLEVMHKAANWPETRLVERRRFRDVWSSATTYAALDEVYHIGSGKYAIALRASTNQEPYDSSDALNTAYWAELKFGYSGDDWLGTTTYSTVGTIVRYTVDGYYYALHTAAPVSTVPTNSTYWGRLSDFDSYIAFEQTGQTAIETVYNIWDQNPNATVGVNELPFLYSVNGVQVTADPLPAQVWVEFRTAPKRLTGDTLDLTATYASGEQVYYASTTNGVFTSDFYDVASATSAGETPASAAAKFTVVSIPARFRVALTHFSAAHWLRAQGHARREDADREELMAFSALSAELTRLTNQSGQHNRPTVKQ